MRFQVLCCVFVILAGCGSDGSGDANGSTSDVPVSEDSAPADVISADAPQTWCPNGVCEQDEVCMSVECETDACTVCPQDCCPVCGDGICDEMEKIEMNLCELDCGADCGTAVCPPGTSPVFIDGECTEGEYVVDEADPEQTIGYCLVGGPCSLVCASPFSCCEGEQWSPESYTCEVPCP